MRCRLKTVPYRMGAHLERLRATRRLGRARADAPTALARGPALRQPVAHTCMHLREHSTSHPSSSAGGLRATKWSLSSTIAWREAAC